MIKYQPQSGFSLVETLVAITILLIVIVGPIAIVSSASNSAMFASDQVTAFLLAQEGAELAQKVRDDLVLAKFNNSGAPNPWTTFTNTAIGGTYRNCFVEVNSSGCGLEIGDANTGTLDTIQNCATSPNCRLYYSGDNNERSFFTYNQTGNSATIFTRVITFQNISTQEVRVVSRVTWFSGISRNAREVEVETYLFNVYGI